MENIATKYINTWANNSQYFEMLKLMASLSKLFSESTTPYLDYRLTENLFCKYFDAVNDARSCTAYDAHIGNLGIGIKTFGIPKKGCSTEKIAEFNKLKPELDKLKDIELARKLAQVRNDRIIFANNVYSVSNSIYHIVGRIDGGLRIFNTPYTLINIDKICDIKENEASISFCAGDDFYSFNKSKSVLMKQFVLPETYKDIPVQILADPIELLSSILKSNDNTYNVLTNINFNQKQILGFKPRIKGIDYVILPLYSTRNKQPQVPEKSGLNQWNANGRARNEDEVYIPIPKKIHKEYPNFFPDRKTIFALLLPDGQELSAKICQSDGKGLMSNPNAALGHWILRTVLHKKPGDLVTMNDLIRFGIDSVLVEKTHKRNTNGQDVFSISFTISDYETYKEFIEEDFN